MPTWTKEQTDAIYKSGTNIIVSAGAGSGKTAVLTERVLQKLTQGIHINQLLILTFTKAAAGEMKDRIRSKIQEIPSLKNELSLLDSAYITTFDAFSLSVVKKYHYLLNISKHPEITNDAILELLRKDTMRNILNECYEKQNEYFTKFIEEFCVKNDDEVYDCLLKISRTLEKEVSKIHFLDNYSKVYFREEKITQYLQEYENLLHEKQEEIKEKLQGLKDIAPQDYQEKCEQALQNLLDSKTIDTISSYKSTKLPQLPRGTENEVKEKKEQVSSSLKKLQELLEYGREEQLKKDIEQLEKHSQIFCDILKKYFKSYETQKKEKEYYDFNDIAFLALHLIEQYPNIREELTSQFQEIMIDEYQDTNDIQENFIKQISHHNVYMVGDIKQSIYRFRNANPTLFKKKYDNYRKEQEGIKIDLVKNFRSRKEVLQNINHIFTQIMDDTLGGANYLLEHQMVFGNNDYIEKGNTKENYQMEIYTYEHNKETPFTKDEIEIFMIGRDIQTKINENYLIFDKTTKQPRSCSYKDFVILMDRSTNFNLYKKIFNHLKIPICLYKDEALNNSNTFYVITSMLTVLNAYNQKKFDTHFQFSFTSIARSYLFELQDEEIYKTIKEHKWYENPIYENLKSVIINLSILSLTEILDTIYEQTNIYEKIIKIGDIKENMLILKYIKELASSYGKEGKNMANFIEFLSRINKEEMDLKYSAEEPEENSVKIMTIHKSKGLEYPICYFSGLYKSFNISDMKEKFMYSSKYGIITPLKKEGLSLCFLKELEKENYIKEEISEKIRLFYVAVTRAKEKMIFVLPNNPKPDENLSLSQRLKCRSLGDFLYLIWKNLNKYRKIIHIEDLNITKDYLFTSTKTKTQEISNEKIEVQELNISKMQQEAKKFSKANTTLQTKEENNNIKLGRKVHEYLEYIDFKNPNYESIKEPFIKNKIKKFIDSSLIQENLENQIYKEYEFIFELGNQEYHGIIDLIIEQQKKIIIIDYKLNNLLDDAYIKQLEGYKNYIEKKTEKPVETYLYSILEETIIPIHKEQVLV